MDVCDITMCPLGVFKQSLDTPSFNLILCFVSVKQCQNSFHGCSSPRNVLSHMAFACANTCCRLPGGCTGLTGRKTPQRATEGRSRKLGWMVPIIKCSWPVRRSFGQMVWVWTFPKVSCTGWMLTTTVLSWFTSTPQSERLVTLKRVFRRQYIYIFTGDEPRSLFRFNRWCMRGRSLTTPLDYAITSNFSFGMNTGVAASTNWTRSPRRSRSSATRGRPSLRSECMMHTSSKVYLPSLHSFSLHDMLLSKIWRPSSTFLLGFSFVCRLQCVSS